MKYITLLFHFNQNIVPYAEVANEVCYKGLLRVLLSHPKLKFMIHISGTLLNALKWIDPYTIELIKKGIKAKQFELVGSTYSQNVIYSFQSICNEWQIKFHKELLEQIFNVTPVSFWNPERCFTHSILKLISKYGYKYTWIEDHILEKSGKSKEDTIITTPENIIIFQDDKEFLKTVNKGIFTGDIRTIFEFINKQDSNLLNYAEDAESMGLWQYEGSEGFNVGSNPEKIWNNLDKFLTQIENNKDLQLTTFTEYIKLHSPEKVINKIEDGQAVWMVDALKNSSAKYHENGYIDWFDFNNRSIDLNYYRTVYKKIIKLIEFLELQYQNSFNKEKLNKIIDYIKLFFIIHQYEFGCTGVVRINDIQWEGVKEIYTLAYIAQLALIQPKKGILILEINKDKVEEIFLINNKQLFVFSPIGGRLIYWFDLNSCVELIGNYCTSIYGEKVSYYTSSLFINIPKLENNELKFINKRYGLRKRALNDIFYIGSISKEELKDPKKISQFIENGKIISKSNLLDIDIPFDAKYKYNIYENNLEFIYTSKNLKIIKKISPQKNGININYTITNISDKSIELNKYIQNEFCPDYFNLLMQGKEGLDIKIETNNVIIYNTNTKIGIKLEKFSEHQHIEVIENFIGIEVNLHSNLYLESKSSCTLEFNISKI